jgi:hypothetical protein
MATLQPQFATLNAAADALVNGGILVPEFQKEITDIVKRSGPLFNRMEKVPATGAISRYFEQTAIGQGAFSGTGSQAASPIGSGTIAPTPTSPTRAEKSLLIKAITNELIYSGLDGHIIVPGAGALMIEAGRLYVVDDQLTDMVGRHTWRANDPEVMARLCSLLAGH